MAQDIALAGAELVERPLMATAPEHAPDHLRIESAAPVGDARNGIPERIDVADALLQQVADALCAVADEVKGVVLLVVLGEHQHAGLGQHAPQLDRCAQAVVCPPRRHLDVDDCDIRLMCERLAQERIRIACLADDSEPGLREQTRYPLAHQNVVLPDDYAQGLLRHDDTLLPVASGRAIGATATSGGSPAGRSRDPPWR